MYFIVWNYSEKYWVLLSGIAEIWPLTIKTSDVDDKEVTLCIFVSVCLMFMT